MKEYATEYIRNIALVSHGGGGKTILGEAMLFCTGALTRMGKVEEVIGAGKAVLLEFQSPY